MRSALAYTTPSLLFLGLAVHECAGCFFLLLKPTTKRNPMYIISSIAWVSLAVYISVSIILLDYINSPWISDRLNTQELAPFPNQWIATLIFLICIAVFLTGSGVMLTALLRIRVCFGSSRTFWAMASVAYLATVTRMASLLLVLQMAVRLYNDPNDREIMGLDFANGKLYKIVMAVVAVDQLFEGTFLILTSAFFFAAVGQGLRSSWTQYFIKVCTEYGGIRLILIVVLNLLIGLLSIYAAFHKGNHTFLTHSGIYIIPWMYSTALYAFLQTSYVSAKEIIAVSARQHSPAPVDDDSADESLGERVDDATIERIPKRVAFPLPIHQHQIPSNLQLPAGIRPITPASRPRERGMVSGRPVITSRSHLPQKSQVDIKAFNYYSSENSGSEKGPEFVIPERRNNPRVDSRRND